MPAQSPQPPGGAPGGGQVDPAAVHTLAELVAALQVLRAWRSYEALDRAVGPGDRLPKSTLNGLLSTGRSTVETFELFLRACDVPREQRAAWRAARERALSEVPPELAGVVRVERSDPRRLGVHAAIDTPGATDDLPVYVERDVDAGPRGMCALVGRAAERGGLVVLVGSSSVGKTRCAYEAVREVVPQWWLLHPSDAEHVRQAAATAPARLVVWLDELQRYLGGPAGLNAGTVRTLLGAGAVLVATLWPDRYAAYTELPKSGQPDPHAAERELLGLADVVHLEARFSAAERERAQTAARAGDRRIALALKSTDYGLTQVIAAAPQLVDRWRGADPYAAAVLNAAVDATRVGVRSPLTADLLRDAAPGYCDARQRAGAPPNWFEAALAYATQELNGAAAALAPVAAPGTMGRADGYLVADYLRQHAGGLRRMLKVPASTWQALSDHLTDPGDQGRTGAAAQSRLLYRYAEPLLRHATDAGDEIASGWLVALLVWQERMGEVRARADAGDETAAKRLANLAKGRTSEEELRAGIDAGNKTAFVFLTEDLVGFGRMEEAVEFLRPHIAGNGYAAKRLAELLEHQGQAEEAIEVLRARAEAAGYTDIGLANLLERMGRMEEAIEILRARSDNGYAAKRLAELLIVQDQVEEEVRARADTGDESAAKRLVQLLAWHGRVEELRARAEAGHWFAAMRLIDLLLGQGRVGEAIEILRAQADAGDEAVDERLVDLLLRQGQTEEVCARADAGDELAALRLVEYLVWEGQADEAIEVLRARVDAGQWNAAERLVELLERQGQGEEAERLRRFGLSADD
ncbi:tetratricopeptide repeat protein [Streptosporangium sp. NPDC003464]